VEQSAFYTLGSVSFGLQIGGEAAEVVLLVMSQKGVDSLLTSKFKLVETPPSLLAGWRWGEVEHHRRFISFAKSKGLYAGLNLDGSYLSVRESINKAYYGKEATPWTSSSRDRSATKGGPAERRVEEGEIGRGSPLFGMREGSPDPRWPLFVSLASTNKP